MLLDVRLSESRDRHVAEANFEHVNIWSLLNVVAMVTTGVAQVLIVRSLFAPDEFPLNCLKKFRK